MRTLILNYSWKVALALVVFLSMQSGLFEGKSGTAVYAFELNINTTDSSEYENVKLVARNEHELSFYNKMATIYHETHSNVFFNITLDKNIDIYNLPQKFENDITITSASYEEYAELLDKKLLASNYVTSDYIKQELVPLILENERLHKENNLYFWVASFNFPVMVYNTKYVTQPSSNIESILFKDIVTTEDKLLRYPIVFDIKDWEYVQLFTGDMPIQIDAYSDIVLTNKNTVYGINFINSIKQKMLIPSIVTTALIHQMIVQDQAEYSITMSNEAYEYLKENSALKITNLPLFNRRQMPLIVVPHLYVLNKKQNSINIENFLKFLTSLNNSIERYNYTREMPPYTDNYANIDDISSSELGLVFTKSGTHAKNTNNGNNIHSVLINRFMRQQLKEIFEYNKDLKKVLSGAELELNLADRQKSR